jgi:hypothetical protein
MSTLLPTPLADDEEDLAVLDVEGDVLEHLLVPKDFRMPRKEIIGAAPGSCEALRFRAVRGYARMAALASIEVKVGILILTAHGPARGVHPGHGRHQLPADVHDLRRFRQSRGASRRGRPVKIARVKVGKIKEIQFRGGKVDENRAAQPLVRASPTSRSATRKPSTRTRSST